MQQPIMTFKVKGKPSFIIPNYDGQGYGRFTLDDEYTSLLPLRLITTRNDLNRYVLLLTTSTAINSNICNIYARQKVVSKIGTIVTRYFYLNKWRFSI